MDDPIHEYGMKMTHTLQSHYDQQACAPTTWMTSMHFRRSRNINVWNLVQTNAIILSSRCV